ncbi:MAG: T9SS type A sorting domain-containing protein, partial [candidate division WOR-3 bacterium]|nr:T9SS type A sorting domain-containing protein [candidate division WOR-3 bacterium]
GPMSINPFGIRRFAVAFVGGASEDEALINADSARSWYHRYIGLQEEAEGDKKLSELLVDLRVEVVPNPSRTRALVRYQVPIYGRVRIEAVDVAGRVVDRLMDKFTSAGAGEIVWQPEGLGPGVYFIRMETGKRMVCQRLLLLE